MYDRICARWRVLNAIVFVYLCLCACASKYIFTECVCVCGGGGGASVYTKVREQIMKYFSAIEQSICA